MNVSLRLTAAQHAVLRRHLYPGDGLEAIALALCGRLHSDDRHWLVVHKLFPIPYEQCEVRTADCVKWATLGLETLLQEATRHGFGLLKIHSHPGGFSEFSDFDDASDLDLFESVYGWLDDDLPHVSAVMLPDGSLFGRAIDSNCGFHPLTRISLVGDDLLFWDLERQRSLPEFMLRHAQAFGQGTTQRLRRLHAAVIGCSGTGSLVIEMLIRLGIGEITLVDPDVVEQKNLNRITNTTMIDAQTGRPKVDAIAEAIGRIGLGTQVHAIKGRIEYPDIIRRVACCDVIFGCVDSVEGRDTLNALATCYLVPYFDLGVRLEADGEGGIDHVFGSVHYLQPGGSSLRSRGVYSSEDLHAEYLRRVDPGAYENQRDAGYIVGVEEDRPAVISINALLAAMAVNEFLARIHPYRDDPNGDYAVHRISLNQGWIYKERDGSPDRYLARLVGRGDMKPILNMPRLSANKESQI